MVDRSRLDYYELIQSGLSPTSAYALLNAEGLSKSALQTVNDDNWDGTPLSIGNGGTGATSATEARDNLGLGDLAEQDTVNNDDWDGTDLAVANGGTGASGEAGARQNLSAVGFGAHNANLSFVMYVGIVDEDGNFDGINPDGWSVVRDDPGVYTITHNLGLANPIRHIVQVTAVDLDRIGSVSTRTANTFTIRTRNISVNPEDSAFNFTFIKTE